MTSQTPPVQRRPLTRIDVRSDEAARQLARILPAAGGTRPVRASTFNSAL